MGIVANSIAKDQAMTRQNNRQKAMRALASTHAPKYSNFDNGYTRAMKESDSRANIETGLKDYMIAEKMSNGNATPGEIGQYRADQNEPMERQMIEQAAYNNSLAGAYTNSSLGSGMTNQDRDASLGQYLMRGNR